MRPSLIRKSAVVLVLVALAVAAYPFRNEIAMKVIHAKRLALDQEPCPKQTARTMVAFVFGQSNSANSGAARHRAGPTVMNLFEGRCFPAQDPLLGADGVRGSVWPVFGDDVAREHDAIVIVAAGVGGVRVGEWNGRLIPLLMQRLEETKAAGYHVTHFLWHQGEGDASAGTPSADYVRDLRAVISRTRAVFPDAGFWIATASVCSNAGSSEVVAAQRSLVDPAHGIYAGPNTDSIPLADRRDGCHFGANAQAKVAGMWADAVRSRQPPDVAGRDTDARESTRR